MRRVTQVSVALFVVLASSLTHFKSATAQVKEYTPEQVISTFYQSMRSILGFENDSNSSIWLSLSLVGSFVDANDQSQVNDLANFCPDPTPVLVSYARIRKLDDIYQKLLNSLTGPKRDHSKAYEDAQKFLRGSSGMGGQEYTTYFTYYDKYNAAFAEYLLSNDASVRAQKLDAIARIERDWLTFGYRAEVEKMFEIIDNENFTYGDIEQQRRRRILLAYRAAGLSASDKPGAEKSPASELSLPPGQWANAAWTSVKFSQGDTEMTYSAEQSARQGFGGLSLGFVQIVGTAGGGNSSESRVNKVSNFEYSYEVARISIRRPWLDTDVLFEPQGWTWQVSQNTSIYPLVSSGADANGAPTSPSAKIYDNTAIDCPLYPLELVIARNRSLTATVSKDSYESITSSGSSGGGGGLFGLFGGSRKTWTTTKISETSSDVTFRIDAPTIAVVGMISQFVPKLPTPNTSDVWPDNAWLPQ